ncbi:MAG TPA: hypothetical protein VL358_01115 [Caulobacteraceae bacterium]|jgi:hypothetical protein|nr:hypothetical protein [Caulobacteraceae bacterium]
MPQSPWTIPPPNQPDARQAFWDRMAQLFNQAEQSDQSNPNRGFADANRSGPQFLQVGLSLKPSGNGPSQPPPEWRWPDVFKAYDVYKNGFNIPGHNDLGDAERHAQTAKALSGLLGPTLTEGLDAAREYWERFNGEPRGEMIMDLHNNAEGVDAYRKGRPIDTNGLQRTDDYDPRRFPNYRYR